MDLGVGGVRWTSLYLGGWGVGGGTRWTSLDLGVGGARWTPPHFYMVILVPILLDLPDNPKPLDDSERENGMDRQLVCVYTE